jgi:peptidoglycan/LPS O-acetylase OafA/YrhL
VLSGFLVSGLLFEERFRDGRVRLGRFLIRRAFKIYPPFWLLLGYGLGLSLLRGKAIAWKELGIELAFLQNYFPGLWQHTWSLAVEEHFYLLLAGAFLIAAPIGGTAFRRAVPWSVLCLGIVCLGFRFLEADRTFDVYEHHFPTHMRIDSLGFGVLAAWLFHCHRESVLSFANRYRPALLVFGLLGFLPAFFSEIGQTAYLQTVGFTCHSLSAGFLLVGALATHQPLGRLGQLLSSLGRRSYSIYIWHIPVERASNALALKIHDPNLAWSAYAIVYLLGTFGVGLVMAKAVEFPALRLRDRIFPNG